MCLTRQQAIGLIAHFSDIVHPNTVSKEVIWGIAERETRLTHCNPNGQIRVSSSGSRGLIQVNPSGVWKNCSLNRWCKTPKMIDEPQAQLELLFSYFRVYRDLCPWNPRGNYLPGCGYGSDP